MIIISAVATLFAGGAWISANRTRREQARTAREKEEDEVYIRIQAVYDRTVKTLEEQLVVANNRIAEQNNKIQALEETILRLQNKPS